MKDIDGGTVFFLFIFGCVGLIVLSLVLRLCWDILAGRYRDK